MHILILGGTGFIGPHQLDVALARGHRVTVFNRGQSGVPLPPGVEALQGDRDADGYSALAGRRFDVCIDNASRVPQWVRGAAQALAGAVDHYLFISTVSVYASHAASGDDETAPRAVHTGPDPFQTPPAELRANMAWYGALKALCEDEAHRHFAGRCTVVRPGLIVGPGDETDRFSYWPLRVRRGGRVLVPPLADPVTFVDVRDLAQWTIRLAEARVLGDFDAFGPALPLTMGEMLEAMRTATGTAVQWVQASAAWLAQHEVAPWRDLPVWLPADGDSAGLHRRKHARALAAGLTFRPLADTARDTLTWWQSLSAQRQSAPLRAGLSAEREAELLSLLSG